jgi:hypothetical protein
MSTMTEPTATVLHRLAHEALAGPLGYHQREDALDTLVRTGPCSRCDASVVALFLGRQS